MVPLKKTSALQAYAQLQNTDAFWPGRSAEPSRLGAIATPSFRPSFRLIPGEAVFTIGSCFARNIEKHLKRLGYKIPMAEYVPEELIGQPLDGFANKFSPQSMLNEVAWAFGGRQVDPAYAFLEQPDGLFLDPQLMSKGAVTRERAIERRGEINGLFRLIPQCRVVIITLGLVEAWYDTKAGVYLNRSVPRYNATIEPDRFELHVLSFNELLESTRRLTQIIMTKGHPDCRIILTVSPVPLTATFTDQDVLVANAYSKAALRTVAEHIATEVGSSRVDLQACKLEYSIVSPK